MIPFNMIRPFDKESGEIDKKIKGLWTTLIAVTIMLGVVWFSVSKYMVATFKGLQEPSCIAFAFQTVLLAVLVSFILFIIVKIGVEARKFMKLYNERKGKKNGEGK
jgi:hypothetical protein